MLYLLLLPLPCPRQLEFGWQRRECEIYSILFALTGMKIWEWNLFKKTMLKMHFFSLSFRHILKILLQVGTSHALSLAVPRVPFHELVSGVWYKQHYSTDTHRNTSSQHTVLSKVRVNKIEQAGQGEPTYLLLYQHVPHTGTEPDHWFQSYMLRKHSQNSCYSVINLYIAHSVVMTLWIMKLLP